MNWETPKSSTNDTWNDAVPESSAVDSWNSGGASKAQDDWNASSAAATTGRIFCNAEGYIALAGAGFDAAFGSGDARDFDADAGNAPAGDDEAAWGNDRPQRDFSDMKCYNCQGMGHGSRNCTEPPREREIRPLIDWSHHPEMDSEEAWAKLKAADVDRDLDDIKEAFEIYAKNTPDATFQTIEERLRAEGMNLRLVCLEKEIPMNKTNVNLQMEADKKYVVGYQLSKKSKRTRMIEGMLAESDEDNFERLSDCGFTVASSVPVCYNCNQKGHVGKNCPEERPAEEDRDLSHVVKVVCTNCEQEGHRLRNCPEPRKVRSRGCRNCGSEEHMVADCDQPKRPREGESCYNCGSEEHYGKDCPEEKKPRADTRECYNCQQTGHIGKDCPEPRRPRPHREAAPAEYPEPAADDFGETDGGFNDAAQDWQSSEQPAWQTTSAAPVAVGGW